MNSVPSMSYIKKSKLNDTNININISNEHKST